MNKIKTTFGYIMCLIIIASCTLFVNYGDIKAPSETNIVADVILAADRPTHKPEPKTTISETIKKADEMIASVKDTIRDEQVTRIKKDPVLASRSGTYRNPHAVKYTSDDVELMARMIMAEGGNQPFEAKLGMGTVMINRVFTWFGDERSYSYDKLKKVLLNHSQFNAVGNKNWFKSYIKYTSYVPSENIPNDECYTAARAILNGYRSWDGDESVAFFYATGYHVDGTKQVQTIGDTEFARKIQ